MIENIKTCNVGPVPNMDITFGQRLNILTGDNGLGKSFLLDIVWWALTQKWPSDVNPHLTAGKKALPANGGDASIAFSFPTKSTHAFYEYVYRRDLQQWIGRRPPGPPPANPGLVLYAMSDGSFAVWDPHRNYQRTTDNVEIQDRPAAYIFGPGEVWDGLPKNTGNAWLCNGLIRDWASWQKENGAAFSYLKEVLTVLSPLPTEKLEPGQLRRISLDDVRDIPTIKMPYNQDVPVLHASAGIRRIIALAYFLVWAWEEHNQAAIQLGKPATKQVTFLIDEIEAHLHPSWQRRIVPALLSVIKKLAQDAEVQLITATHSSLIMASLEPLFDSSKDAWFDFNLQENEVTLQQYDFEKHGDVLNWLTSAAFGLPSSRPLEYEGLIDEAAHLLEQQTPDKTQIAEMHEKLLNALSPKDSFLFNWRSVCAKKGWLA